MYMAKLLYKPSRIEMLCQIVYVVEYFIKRLHQMGYYIICWRSLVAWLAAGWLANKICFTEQQQ